MTLLGATPIAGGTRFTVRAAEADAVTLCLFDTAGVETQQAMTRDGDCHVAEVIGVGPGQRYGYRATGRWSPGEGLWFDAAKLLVDPYAVALDRRFAYDRRLAEHGADTAALVPKAIVPDESPATAPPPPVFREGGLIYELSVRSFTMRHPEVPPAQRGTIAALAHPAVIDHLRRLHVAAVELMPVVAWIDERHLPPLGLVNAWGYNPVVSMALDPGLAPGGVAELRETVAALRAAGIGVILDVVFNHSGESDADGPTLALRGLDQRYHARGADGVLINDTGTGNTLDGSQPIVRQLILDTLRHFVGQCGVDGFRFDLAPVMARAPGFDPHAPIFAAIANDPLLADRVMIAEPWDVGPGGYQLGRFPGHWLEWNDRYRDDVRRFWRGDPGTVGALATRLSGSSDVFGGGRTRGVSFVAAHDGATLADLISYAGRHNLANGEDNRDGGDEVRWNNGVEGPSDDPAITVRRREDVRALLATLFASRGTIQLTAGDEFGRTQAGNNNAYAQDNAVTWLDWTGRDQELEAFVAALAAFRAAHPVVSDPAFLHNADWRDLAGAAMTPAAWEAPDCAGFELRLPSGAGRFVAIRIDRSARRCTLAEVEEVAS